MAATLGAAESQPANAPASRPLVRAAMALAEREFPNTAEGRYFKKIVQLRESLMAQTDPERIQRDLKHLTALAVGFCARYPDSPFVPETKVTQAMALLSMSRMSQLGLSYIESARQIVEPILKQSNLDQDTRVIALFGWADIMLQRGNMPETLKALREIGERHSGHPRAAQGMISMGQLFAGRMEYDEALQTYRAVVEKYPSQPEALHALFQSALILSTTDKMDQALSVVDEMITRSPESEEVQAAMTTIAHTLEDKGRKDEAIAEYRRIVTRFAGKPIADAASGRIRFLGLKGTHVDDVEMKTLDERVLRPSDFRGKVLILYFWGFWNTESVNQIMRVDWTYKRVHPMGAEAVGIYFGPNKDELQQLLTNAAIEWPQVIDNRGLGGPLAIGLGVESVPMTLVIDGKGVVRHVGLLGPELHKAVEELLDELPPMPASRLAPSATKPASAPVPKPQ